MWVGRVEAGRQSSALSPPVPLRWEEEWLNDGFLQLERFWLDPVRIYVLMVTGQGQCRRQGCFQALVS